MNLIYKLVVGNKIVESYINGQYNINSKNCNFVIDHNNDIIKKYLHKNLQNIFVYYKSNRMVQFNNVNDSNISINDNIYGFTPQINFNIISSWFIEKASEEAREAVNSENLNYKLPELTAVRQAISKALGQYHDPYVINTPPEICINKIDDKPRDKSKALKIEQLSDGYRSMLAMVMDIARRMAVANAHAQWPEGQTVLHSPGIVLIDEVELHLHPSWQQTVLPTLMEIFPNIQFIVTTHSPQILTSVKAENIRILDGKGNCFNAPHGTWGAEASRVMKDIMSVDNRPPCKATDELNEYSRLVYADNWNSEKALALREILDSRYGKQEPKLLELDLYIDNRKWELDENQD